MCEVGVTRGEPDDRRAAAPELAAEAQRRMVERLQDTLRASEGECALIETHISYVLIAGGIVHKLKKAVQLDFLDFSTRAARRHFCDEELRLNRRTAAGLYLDVVDVTGTPERPVFGGEGPLLDHALRMRAFAQEALWDRSVREGRVEMRHIDRLAERLAAFHAAAAVSGAGTAWGAAPRVRAPMRDNFLTLEALPLSDAERADCAALSRWEEAAYGVLAPAFDARQRAGRVRECHGDLHLGNLVMIDDTPVLFDALEFDPALRWTDVMSDVAFVAMDLQAHARADLAHRFVNAYLEAGGDYDGVPVLRYYLVHRALVRAKVAGLRARQEAKVHDDAGAAGARRSMHDYLSLARDASAPPRPLLMFTHGFSGSGKTSLTQPLVEAAGVLRVRADVERKRLHGLAAGAASSSAVGEGLYTEAATRRTYARLEQAAAAVIAGGRSVLLDATFLRRAQRDRARACAHALGVECLMLDFRAETATLQERVRQRSARGDDASEADLQVLTHQLSRHDPLAADELAAAHAVDTDRDLQGDDLRDLWRGLLPRLRGNAG